MPKRAVAKLFRNGRSQAVRLPQEFRFEGDRVSIQKVAGGVLLQPVKFNVKAWFDELDRLNSGTFMRTDRKQPKTPRRKVFE